MPISSTVTRFGLAAASVLALGLTPAAAQDYPSQAVDFIVPFDPGGGADASQRAFNKYAEPIVGQPLVIVNKPGAGGTKGWAEMVRAEPDGYTLAIVTPPFNVIPPLARPQQTGYTLDQFTYICTYAVVPDVLLVREDSEYETLADLIDYAKANPGKIKAANTGTLGADFMTTLADRERDRHGVHPDPVHRRRPSAAGHARRHHRRHGRKQPVRGRPAGQPAHPRDRSARARSEHPGRADLQPSSATTWSPSATACSAGRLTCRRRSSATGPTSASR